MASLDPEPAPINSQNRLGRLLRFKWRHSHPVVSSPAQVAPPAEVVQPQIVEPQLVQPTIVQQQIVESHTVQPQIMEAKSAQPELFVSSPELDAALDIAVCAGVLNTGATAVAIALIEKGKLVCRARLGDLAPDLGVALNVSSGITGACVRTAHVLTCSDTQTDERVDAEVCRILGIRSILVVPILVSGGVAGILEALSSNPETFTRNHSQRLQQIATFVSGLAYDDAKSAVFEVASSAQPQQPSSSPVPSTPLPSTPLAGAQAEAPEDTSLSAFRDVLEKIGPKSSWEDISQELVSHLQGGKG
jgi:putative methionine-R-sulfoxide reductase with GAF domain